MKNFIVKSSIMLGLVTVLFCTDVAFSQQKPPLKSLNVGNFWVYRYGSSKAPRPELPKDAYERVVGTQFFGGKEYARVFNSYFQQYFFERSDSNTVYRWNTSQGREITAFSLNWKEGDTVNFEFFWHGCQNCKYVVLAPSKFFNTGIRDTTYSFILADAIPIGLRPVPPYDIRFARKYLFNQIDSSRLNASRTSGEIVGTTFLKGAFVDGVVLRDTNIITSVVEDPLLSLAQSKPNDNAQVASTSARRVAVQMSAENPFSSRTQVRYRLEQAGTVELAVYNAQGVRLATMQRGRKAAGEQTASWNGTSTEGLEVPAGAYFLVLFVDERQVGEVKVVKVR
ncbi:MAG: hypothetical protein EAZ92_17800 [Candidatus Kapaibacterium sp.]|nr:MAG: hypothetical protein EAZ92_17800 [Candidatus Kapabacteria bacterium]